MTVYVALKLLHVVAAIVSVGAMVVLPSLAWVLRAGPESLRHKALRRIDLHISIAGWALVLSGLALLGMTGWAWLHAGWLLASLGIIVAALVFDALVGVGKARASEAATLPHGTPVSWMIAKGALFLLVAALMVAKPG